MRGPGARCHLQSRGPSGQPPLRMHPGGLVLAVGLARSQAAVTPPTMGTWADRAALMPPTGKATQA